MRPARPGGSPPRANRPFLRPRPTAAGRPPDVRKSRCRHASINKVSCDAEHRREGCASKTGRGGDTYPPPAFITQLLFLISEVLTQYHLWFCQPTLPDCPPKACRFEPPVLSREPDARGTNTRPHPFTRVDTLELEPLQATSVEPCGKPPTRHHSALSALTVHFTAASLVSWQTDPNPRWPLR
jgi:hypothetical protein